MMIITWKMILRGLYEEAKPFLFFLLIVIVFSVSLYAGGKIFENKFRMESQRFQMERQNAAAAVGKVYNRIGGTE
jgi:hypothetical protein